MDMLNDFLEKTLEDIIYNNRKVIHKRGLAELKENAYRQVILPSGRKIDILGFEIQDGILYCDIYELKREIINADAICQAFNYYTELKFITRNFFSRIEAKLIMIGRKYEQVSIIDALPVPVDVYTYEYYIDGIQFRRIDDRYSYSEPHASFSFGLWAFGYGGLAFTNERTSVRFHAEYEDYFREKPDFGLKIKGYIEYYVKSNDANPLPVDTLKVEPDSIELKLIKTEIFPEQPRWTTEFSSSIPYSDNIVDEFDGNIDDELEYDNSDYEPDSDYEEELLEENENVLISEKEYRKSVELNSYSIIRVLSKKEYREMQLSLDYRS